MLLLSDLVVWCNCKVNIAQRTDGLTEGSGVNATRFMGFTRYFICFPMRAFDKITSDSCNLSLP